MIHLTPYEQEKWTFLFVEISRGRPSPLDIQKLERPETEGSKSPKVDGKKGLIISCPTHFFIGMRVGQIYRNRTQWLAVYEASFKGAVVVETFSNERVVGELIPVLLPCLECQKQSVERWVRRGAKYPYCYEHQEFAPHRF